MNLILLKTQSYFELKQITDKVYNEISQNRPQPYYAEEVVNLLARYKIILRQKDGVLHQVNISIPTSVSNAIVVGLRYIKNDGSKTEDLFLFQSNQPIITGYKGRLEKGYLSMLVVTN